MSVNIYDKENNKLIRTADLLPEGGGGEVIDNLTSTDIDKALSANQGRVLNEKISNIYNEGFASENLLPFNSFERSSEGFLVENFSIHIPKGTYTLSANVEGDDRNGWAWIFSKNGVDIATFDGGYVEQNFISTKTLSEDADSLRVWTNGRVKATNIMFNKGSEALLFQPYAKNNAELTECINTISDAYDSSTTYSAGQYCIYNNMLWRSLLDNNLANTPAEGTYWTTTSVSKNLITKNGEGKFGYLGADDSFVPFKSGEEPVLLWENPNPTSAFDAQKIDLDLSEYDNVIISVATINGSAGQTTINNVLLPKNLSTIVGISGSYSGNNIGTRQVRIIDDTGITFGYGSYRGKAPSADDRGWGIPQKIWGVPTKFEVVTKNIAMQEWLTASMTTAYTITKDYEYVTILSGNTVTFSGNIGETLVAKQQIIGTSSYYYYIFKDVRSGTKFTPASTSYGMQITAIPYV